MKFVFRVDASQQIGMGHVMRCLTLAEELRCLGHDCTFVSRAHKGHPGKLIKVKGFDIVLMEAVGAIETKPENGSLHDYSSWLGVPWEQDAADTLRVLEQLQPEWLIVDHYALGAKWERRVAPSVTRIMVIDDLANREHQCDFLLDQNLGRDGSDYDPWVPVGCVRLIGPAYALLRPEFARLRDCSLARREKPKLTRILISMGAVDQNNVTGQVLSALANSDLPGHVELDIVLGSSAPHVRDVRAQAASMLYRSTVTIDANDMAERMCAADLSIGAAGSTSWERCCLGLPTIMVVLAANQELISRHLQSFGAGVIIESSSMADKLGKILVSLQGEPGRLVSMSNACAKVTSGLGSKAVCTAIAGVLH